MEPKKKTVCKEILSEPFENPYGFPHLGAGRPNRDKTSPSIENEFFIDGLYFISLLF